MSKRFYKTVSAEKEGDIYLIKLDGRTLKTPGKKVLTLPDEKTAQFIATEWEAQDDNIDPASMPCTRLLNVTIERGEEGSGELIKEIAAYASTDLLCYRKSDPERFAQRQSELWDPVLDWAKGQGVHLNVTDGLTAIDQPEASIQSVRAYAESLDNMRLTLFAHLTSVFGSAILAMAVMKDHLTGAEAFDVSRLDENWQIEQWGEDEEAKANTAKLAADVNALCALIAP